MSEGSLPANWQLSSLACSGDTGGTPTTTNVTARSVSIGLDSGESITCTFTNSLKTDAHVPTTQSVIHRFLTRRLSLLANDEPDRPRFLRRIPGSLWGEPDPSNEAPPTAPLNFSGSSSDLSTQMSMSTSLSQATAYAAANADTQKGVKAASAPQSRFDMWIEAHVNQYNADPRGLSTTGHFNILYLGADYLISNSVLVGALAQIDWTSERTSATQSAVSGTGFMAGPYLSARLTPNLFFDMRAAYGTSDNQVSPFGTYHDKFSTDRWLANARLTGNWWSGNFRFTPSAGVTYLQENQHSYIDSLGSLIPDQTVTLGRVDFGPEIAYRILGADGVIYEPHIKLRGSWDFLKPAATTIGGYLVSNDTWRAQVQAGVIARWTSGYSFRVVGQYDGIGSSSLRSYGGQIWINVPFNMAMTR